jgi:selenocysteine lyase/cysteine desulfurase
MVDAAQTAGKYPIDVQAGNIDLLAFSGHKGMFGPPGTGVLYIGERVELEPLREGGTGSHSELEEQPLALPYRYESGTLNSVGISGLGAGIKYIFKESLEKISNHEQYLVEMLSQGLATIPGVTMYITGERIERAPVVSINIAGYEPGDVGAILDQKYDIKVRTGLHCAPSAHRVLGTYPTGTVRLSPGYFNTVAEIHAALEAIKSIARTDMPSIDREPEKELEKVTASKDTSLPEEA